MPPALGLFSITMLWPSGFDIDCAMTRATVSVGPGANGTSNVIGWVGYCWASALDAAKAAAMPSIGMVLIGILLGETAHNTQRERPGRPSLRHGDAADAGDAPRHAGGAARRRCVRRRPDGQSPAGARGRDLRFRGGALSAIGHAVEPGGAHEPLPARR